MSQYGLGGGNDLCGSAEDIHRNNGRPAGFVRSHSIVRSVLALLSPQDEIAAHPVPRVGLGTGLTSA